MDTNPQPVNNSNADILLANTLLTHSRGMAPAVSFTLDAHQVDLARVAFLDHLGPVHEDFTGGIFAKEIQTSIEADELIICLADSRFSIKLGEQCSSQASASPAVGVASNLVEASFSDWREPDSSKSEMPALDQNRPESIMQAGFRIALADFGVSAKSVAEIRSVLTANKLTEAVHSLTAVLNSVGQYYCACASSTHDVLAWTPIPNDFNCGDFGSGGNEEPSRVQISSEMIAASLIREIARYREAHGGTASQLDCEVVLRIQFQIVRSDARALTNYEGRNLGLVGADWPVFIVDDPSKPLCFSELMSESCMHARLRAAGAAQCVAVVGEKAGESYLGTRALSIYLQTNRREALARLDDTVHSAVSAIRQGEE